MSSFLRKVVLSAATLAALAATALPAAAHDWDRGWDRGPGWDRGRGWHHHRDWDRPRCWMEPRRVWVDTPWGPRHRIVEVRVCR